MQQNEKNQYFSNLLSNAFTNAPNMSDNAREWRRDGVALVSQTLIVAIGKHYSKHHDTSASMEQ